MIRAHMDDDHIVISPVRTRVVYKRSGSIWSMVDLSAEEAAYLRDWLHTYRTPKESDEEAASYGEPATLKEAT